MDFTEAPDSINVTVFIVNGVIFACEFTAKWTSHCFLPND